MYISQIGRELGSKVKMCTSVHGLSGMHAIEQAYTSCTGVHSFAFAPQSRSIWRLCQSRPISFFQLK